jgi:predicted NAD/FAD-dependent oxidoreductase
MARVMSRGLHVERAFLGDDPVGRCARSPRCLAPHKQHSHRPDHDRNRDDGQAVADLTVDEKAKTDEQSNAPQQHRAGMLDAYLDAQRERAEEAARAAGAELTGERTGEPLGNEAEKPLA